MHTLEEIKVFIVKPSSYIHLMIHWNWRKAIVVNMAWYLKPGHYKMTLNIVHWKARVSNCYKVLAISDSNSIFKFSGPQIVYKPIQQIYFLIQFNSLSFFAVSWFIRKFFQSLHWSSYFSVIPVTCNVFTKWIHFYLYCDVIEENCNFYLISRVKYKTCSCNYSLLVKKFKH